MANRKVFVGSAKAKVDNYKNQYHSCWMFPSDVTTLQQQLSVNGTNGISGVGFMVCPKKPENVKNGNTHYLLLVTDSKPIGGNYGQEGKASQAAQGEVVHGAGDTASASAHRYSDDDLPTQN